MVDAEPQRRALASEASRRGLTLPKRFAVPDRALWEPGYAAEADVPGRLTIEWR